MGAAKLEGKMGMAGGLRQGRRDWLGQTSDESTHIATPARPDGSTGCGSLFRTPARLSGVYGLEIATLIGL